MKLSFAAFFANLLALTCLCVKPKILSNNLLNIQHCSVYLYDTYSSLQQLVARSNAEEFGRFLIMDYWL